MNEGNSGTTSVTFTLTLDKASATDVHVAYGTQDGTATVADSDYQAKSGEVVFPAGTTGPADGHRPDQRRHEEGADENFFIDFGVNGSNATIMGSGQHTITIKNDDGTRRPWIATASGLGSLQSDGVATNCWPSTAVASRRSRSSRRRAGGTG